MSIYLHMRAVAESEIRDDHTWLAGFMFESWENLPDECAAGIAEAINKAWYCLNDLYAAVRVLDADADDSWELPIYGGRSPALSADADPNDPPLGILEPAGVSQAAGFLARVSFDELWKVAGAEISWSRGDGEQVRQEFLGYHRDLQGFYGRAAAAGHAVVKKWA
ncbi:DUF1877 family protein [Streptomyces sp. NPDC002734]|uniref:DUF1877 family protein n=1 Tax=Streptomyces sp. NPDC002734 TaxID=3154426 RepID=UPI0033167C2D